MGQRMTQTLVALLYQATILYIMQRISDDSSIFTADAKAVDLALDFIRTYDTNNNFVMFSYSFLVLKAMNHTSSKNPQIQIFFRKMS